MNRRRLRAAALAGAAACGLTGCAGGTGDGDGDGLAVAVTSAPLEYVAERVGGDRVTVTNLTPRGGDSHGLEPTPEAVVALAGADVVVHLSGGMQPGVDEVLAQQPPRHLVDAVDLADLPPDPHFWLDPVRLAELGGRVADELADADPGNAGEYARSAARLDEELAALDAEYAAALAPCRGATLVAAHEAFGYLADRYGLRQVGVTGLDPRVEPSPARLRDAAEEVRDTEARTVFFEAAAGPAVARTLAADLGTATDVLHPIERVEDGETYPGLMRSNLAALARGLACDG
ncbi:zinc transport system substrate-binding protein [Geodermatophilus dictyosporus]|uniref:Zinc transport system substrate-binding protein n=1 Tax=Geodermatophilus dictyosporus TaxID=1523247 RepID=A0A1I5JLK9_9ACTN|nr:metal ABC transporter substrate-binding protein [Geodermatophilus dictyosporus]SFO73694.1 zinc transport system substrate-binding protein [Geodermatophilus dictyosporus]